MTKRKTLIQQMKVMAVLGAMAVSFAGCSSNTAAEQEQSTQTQEQESAGEAAQEAEASGLETIQTEDYVSAAEYKGIPVEMYQPSISEADIQSSIEYLLGVNPPEGVEEGDTVVMDYEGTLDGVAFDGGTAQDAELIIGSGQFIAGFEEGLVGVKAGESVDLDLTFPEDYHAADLAGKAVVFHVTVNMIMSNEPQELTDEFVKRLPPEMVPDMPADCDTVDEFKAYVASTLENEANTLYESSVKSSAIAWLMENSEFKMDPPADMVDQYVETLTFNLNAEAESYGMTLVDFMSLFYGMDETTYQAEIENQGIQSAKQYLLMQDIANKEGLNVDEDEVEASAILMAVQSGVDVETFKAQTDMESFKEYLMGEKVLDFLYEHAVVTEPTAAETVAEEVVETAAETTAEE